VSRFMAIVSASSLSLGCRRQTGTTPGRFHHMCRCRQPGAARRGGRNRIPPAEDDPWGCGSAGADLRCAAGGGRRAWFWSCVNRIRCR
jgi:hypothetical protein